MASNGISRLAALTVVGALGAGFAASCSSSAKGGAATSPTSQAPTTQPLTTTSAPAPTTSTTGSDVEKIGSADIQLLTSDAASANALFDTFAPGRPNAYGFTATDVTSGINNDVYIWTDPKIRPAARDQLRLMLLTIPGVTAVNFDVAPINASAPISG